MPSYITGSNAAMKNVCIRNNINMSFTHSSELLERKTSYICEKQFVFCLPSHVFFLCGLNPYTPDLLW